MSFFRRNLSCSKIVWNNSLSFRCLIYRNVIHRSDSVESARKEIALWFSEGISAWQSSAHPWIYEWKLPLQFSLLTLIGLLHPLFYRYL